MWCISLHYNMVLDSGYPCCVHTVIKRKKYYKLANLNQLSAQVCKNKKAKIKYTHK